MKINELKNKLEEKEKQLKEISITNKKIKDELKNKVIDYLIEQLQKQKEKVEFNENKIDTSGSKYFKSEYNTKLNLNYFFDRKGWETTQMVGTDKVSTYWSPFYGNETSYQIILDMKAPYQAFELEPFLNEEELDKEIKELKHIISIQEEIEDKEKELEEALKRLN